MSSSFFYSGIAETDQNGNIISAIRAVAESKQLQMYVIKQQLGDDDANYGYENALILLAPKHKIILIDFGGDADEMDVFFDDFIEDLSSLSHKYRYKNIVGRARDWKHLITTTTINNESCDFSYIEQLLTDSKIEDPSGRKNSELLISLLTGSINDIDRIKSGVPDNILDKIKQKILLFDGDQTRFIYDSPEKKTIRIQGLSGTGKTELLLHKLKELYLNCDGKIYFACHNKILASSLRNRIPEFFNFMKVEEQIEWNSRLWCSNAWGSGGDKNSGLYSYICRHYGLTFLPYGRVASFERACKTALQDLLSIYESIDEIPPIFDYVLIDESQDFSENFFNLCEVVTKNNVYVAGDIFQSIFDADRTKVANSDYLLSKCYRTDPRTLMAAHAIGMGLFETKKLQWLEDNQWGACGYLFEKHKPEGSTTYTYQLKREPLRRFEDIETTESLEISAINTDSADKVAYIIDALEKIQKENVTATEEDIGIIFLDNSKSFYRIADVLQREVYERFGWELNKAYDSKEKTKGALFVSNKNNVKGLEFPFVICVADTITRNLGLRNSLYMSLTRSFIKTYLLIDLESNIDLIDQIAPGIDKIEKQGVIETQEPTAAEKLEIQMTIAQSTKRKTFSEIFDLVYEELDLPREHKTTLFDMAQILKKQFKAVEEQEFTAKLSNFLENNLEYL